MWVYSVRFIEKSRRQKLTRASGTSVFEIQNMNFACPSRVCLLPHGSVFLSTLAIRIMISTMATVPIIRSSQSNLLNGFSMYSVTG